MYIYIFFFTLIKRGLAKEQQKYVRKKKWKQGVEVQLTLLLLLLLLLILSWALQEYYNRKKRSKKKE